MRIFYVSDLHLRPADPAAARFETFLHSVPAKGDVILLGGDIFDLFVGDKGVFRRQFAGVLGGIRAAAGKGVRVFYLEGNHDFHVGTVFAGVSPVEVKTDDFGFESPGPGASGASGIKIWVAHGDMIDPDDKGYRLLRAVTRNPFFRLFVRLVPGWIVDKVGSRSSHASRRYNNAESAGPHQERLRKLYLEFAIGKVRSGYQHVLVGHSHLRDQIPLMEGNQKGEYLNLGFSSSKLLYGVLEPGRDQFEVREYP